MDQREITGQGEKNPGRSKRLFFSPNHPDWLGGPPSVLFNGYRGKAAGVGVKLTAYLHVPRLRMIGAVTVLPLYAFMA
jgi:hypothetical protein